MIFNKVSELCNAKGISISKLEKETGLGNATIRGWDKSSPRVENLQAVADFFGVSIEYFLQDESEVE